MGGLTYKIKPKVSLSAAWRYLYIDYGSNQLTTQLAESGPVVGFTYIFRKAN